MAGSTLHRPPPPEPQGPGFQSPCPGPQTLSSAQPLSPTMPPPPKASSRSLSAGGFPTRPPLHLPGLPALSLVAVNTGLGA